MGNKPRVRPGLSSPDQSQDVEFTLDKQIDEGQQEREEKEGGGALGPPRNEERYPSDRQPGDSDKEHKTEHKTPDMEKRHRGTFP